MTPPVMRHWGLYPYRQDGAGALLKISTLSNKNACSLLLLAEPAGFEEQREGYEFHTHGWFGRDRQMKARGQIGMSWLTG